MDMQIDSRRVKSERERRAWSQQHLATVTGLSLRTVQRVEQGGAASFETAAALAAILDLPLATLATVRVTAEPRSRGTMRRSTALAGMAGAFIAGVFVTVSSPVIAEDIAVDISVRRHLPGDLNENGALIFEAEAVGFQRDESRNIRIGDALRLKLLPRVFDDQIMISIDLLSGTEPEANAILSPIVVVKDGQPAQITIGASVGAPNGGMPASGVNPFGRSQGKPGYSIQLVPTISAP